jgi:gliding motility-associated-like protein
MFVIDQPDQIMVDLGEDIIVELGDSLVELTAFIDSDFPIDTIIWDQDVTCLTSLCDEVNIFPTNNGTYGVTVIDENGCVGFDEINITIDDVRNVFTANVFIPGNNNGNDEFRIVTGSGVERVNTFLIYDRWGNLMFETTEYEPGVGSAAWDGRFNGTVVQPGVYIYYANVSFIDGFVNEYKGSITVVR